MTHWRCILFGHDFRRITDWLPVLKSADGWDDGVDILALGECKRPQCRRREPRRVFGQHTYGYMTGKSPITLSEAQVRWADELAKLGLFEVEDV
jgi:hypothetical protein